MKKPLFILLLLLSFSAAGAHAQKKDSTLKVPPDVQAQFPGGADKFYEYLRKNIKYPQEAIEHQIEGKVILQFTVGTNGDIENIRVLQGLTAETNSEAARLINGSGNWIPARKNGKFMSSIMTIAIAFNLNHDNKPPGT